jgi:type II secretory pathway predicted ATPase ExeA/septal ring-binding cell division protein DamX
MYLNHFGLNEPPFRITPHTDFFFGGANRGATLEALLYAITHDEGIVKVSGEVGSGKTMLCRVLMERLPGKVQTILLSNPSLSRDEIIYAIAEELDLKPQSERLSLVLLRLQEHLVTLYGENQRVVLLIDEAHAMPQETLEQVRLLSNLESSHSKLLQIVLFGQPELDAHLSMPHMRQLKERITHSFRLEPMLRSDIEAYLDFRMRAAGYRGPNVFNPKAVRRIVKASEGLTRRVNILADKSLLAAFADNEHGITAKHVDRAVRDSEFYRPAFNKTKVGLAAGGVAAGLALGLGLHYLLAPPIQAIPATPIAPITAAPAPIAAPATDATAQTPAQQLGAQANGAAPIPPAPPAPASAPSPATPSAPQADAAPATKAQPEPIAPAATVKAVPAAVIPAAATASTEAEQAGGAKPGSKNYVPPAPPSGKLTRERFAATQEWLKTAPGGQYSVQLLTSNVKDLHRIEDVLARAPGKDLKLSDFYVYGVKINEQQHYRLAYGLYPDLVEVKEGIKNMPAAYRQFGLFFRSVERMRSQNRQ